MDCFRPPYFTIHVPTSRLQRLMQMFSPNVLCSLSHQLVVSSTSDQERSDLRASVVYAVVELMLLWARWDTQPPPPPHRFSISARAITFLCWLHRAAKWVLGSQQRLKTCLDVPISAITRIRAAAASRTFFKHLGHAAIFAIFTQ